MNTKEFYRLVARMRNAQKDYYKTRDSLSLKEAKSLEKMIDEELSRINSILNRKNEPTLFD